MQRIEAIDEYNRAQRSGMRDYREKTSAGKYPYLPALDELLEKTDTESQIPLGTIEIPLDYVVGTKTTGRTMAFASNFMPLLPEDTEFASKWLSLCMAHMEEGIHDAIKAYEYMGRFYVQEGNNRVSVLKCFGADSIFATVTRVVPRFNDTPEIREYYEFMEYYPLCGLYRLHFTQEGSFARLQKALGKAPDEKWTADDKAEVVSLMNWITKAYNAHGGDKMRTTPADVMLLLLRLYKLDELKTYSPAQFAAAIDAVWDNVLALERPEPVKLSTQPAAPAKKNSLLDRILPGIRSEPSHLKVAFVNERTPETSTWTSQHEFGRTQLDQVFAGKVETVAYHGAEPGKNADELVEKAIQDGADMVFTTSPKLVGASLRAALRHPDVRILNCRVDVGDDCITLKSGTEETPSPVPCENIVIANCLLVHGHGGIVIGSEMSGGVRNVTVTNCVFTGTDRGLRVKTRRRRGGCVENLRLSNLVMERVFCPFVFNMYYSCGTAEKDRWVWEKTPYPVDGGTPAFRNIRINGVTVVGATASAGFFYGLAESPIDGLSLTDCHIEMARGAAPEKPAMMGNLEPMSARGFFLRNAKNVEFHNVTLKNADGEAYDTDESVDGEF